MRHFRNPICSALSVLPMLLHRRHGHGLDSSSGIGLTPWAATLVDDSTRLVGAAYDLISPRDRRTTLAADGNEPTAPSSSTPPPPMPPPPAPPPPTPPSPLAPPPPSHYPLPMLSPSPSPSTSPPPLMPLLPPPSPLPSSPAISLLRRRPRRRRHHRRRHHRRQARLHHRRLPLRRRHRRRFPRFAGSRNGQFFPPNQAARRSRNSAVSSAALARKCLPENS